MRISCHKVQQNLSAYLDGELPITQKEAIAQHLMECHDCCREYAQLSATNNALHNWQTPEIDPQLSVVFARQLATRATSATLPQQRRHWSTLTWAAGCAVVLFVAIMVWPLIHTGQKVSTIRVIYPQGPILPIHVAPGKPVEHRMVAATPDKPMLAKAVKQVMKHARRIYARNGYIHTGERGKLIVARTPDNATVPATIPVIATGTDDVTNNTAAVLSETGDMTDVVTGTPALVCSVPPESPELAIMTTWSETF